MNRAKLATELSAEAQRTGDKRLFDAIDRLEKERLLGNTKGAFEAGLKALAASRAASGAASGKTILPAIGLGETVIKEFSPLEPKERDDVRPVQ